jgi:hypothetical protein
MVYGFGKAASRPAICCIECAEELRSRDFLAGRAHYLATGPYCLPCSPLPTPRPADRLPPRPCEALVDRHRR